MYAKSWHSSNKQQVDFLTNPGPACLNTPHHYSSSENQQDSLYGSSLINHVQRHVPGIRALGKWGYMRPCPEGEKRSKGQSHLQIELCVWRCAFHVNAVFLPVSSLGCVCWPVRLHVSTGNWDSLKRPNYIYRPDWPIYHGLVRAGFFPCCLKWFGGGGGEPVVLNEFKQNTYELSLVFKGT